MEEAASDFYLETLFLQESLYPLRASGPVALALQKHFRAHWDGTGEEAQRERRRECAGEGEESPKQVGWGEPPQPPQIYPAAFVGYHVYTE